MSSHHRGTRDLSDLPPSALAARLAQALSERKREREQRSQEPITRRLSGYDDIAEQTAPPVTAREDAGSQPAPAPAPAPWQERKLARYGGGPDEPATVLRQLPRQEPAGVGAPPDGATEVRRIKLRLRAPAAPESQTSIDAAPVLPGATAGDEIERTRAELAEVRMAAQQARADLVAMRRRTEREMLEMSRTAAGDVLAQIIPIVDDLERALNHLPEMMWGDPWVAGVLMIGDRLQEMLEQQHVERIVPQGEPFDPRLHEAVSRVQTSEVPEDTITNVLLPGYILNGRVLRAAQVQVAVRKES